LLQFEDLVRDAFLVDGRSVWVTEFTDGAVVVDVLLDVRVDSRLEDFLR
jgi:hypothetical protein